MTTPPSRTHRVLVYFGLAVDEDDGAPGSPGWSDVLWPCLIAVFLTPPVWDHQGALVGLYVLAGLGGLSILASPPVTTDHRQRFEGPVAAATFVPIALSFLLPPHREPAILIGAGLAAAALFAARRVSVHRRGAR